MAEQHGEERGADLGRLESLLHETVGELRLIGVAAGGEDLPDLLEEDLGAAPLDFGRGRDHAATDAGVGELLEVLDLVDVASAHEGRRHTLAPGAAGTADPVDVVLGIVRQVIVDHHLQMVDVDAAGGHIGGDEELKLRVLELVHHARALGLGDAAVETIRREALRQKRVGQFIDHALGVAEDDAETEAVVIHQTDQRLGLATRGDLVEPLVDGGSGDILALDGHGLGIAGVAVDELLDLAGKRGREEDRLALLRSGVEDPLDIVAEAHVEHPVGLVEDHHLQLVQLQGAALQMVDDAARGADHDLDPFLQLEQLAVIGGPSVNGHRVDRALEGRELVHLVGDLFGEFARRAEHQDLNGPA